MDAFFGIILSAIILYLWGRSQTKEPQPSEIRRNTVKARWDRKRIKAEKLKREARLTREQALEVQKQEDAELISVILPTINHDR